MTAQVKEQTDGNFKKSSASIQNNNFKNHNKKQFIKQMSILIFWHSVFLVETMQLEE